MVTHPKSKTYTLLYRYNPETKRVQFWDTYSNRSRWTNSVTFYDTYMSASVARDAVTRRGYQLVTYASTFCEPETYRTGA